MVGRPVPFQYLPERVGKREKTRPRGVRNRGGRRVAERLAAKLRLQVTLPVPLAGLIREARGGETMAISMGERPAPIESRSRETIALESLVRWSDQENLEALHRYVGRNLPARDTFLWLRGEELAVFDVFEDTVQFIGFERTTARRAIDAMGLASLLAPTASAVTAPAQGRPLRGAYAHIGNMRAEAATRAVVNRPNVASASRGRRASHPRARAGTVRPHRGRNLPGRAPGRGGQLPT